MKAFIIALFSFLALVLSYALPEALGAPLIKVAVLDTGLNVEDPRFAKSLCKTGHKSYNGDKLNDRIGHGTHVAGIIQEYAKGVNYCLIIYKVFQDSPNNSVTDNTIDAIKNAVSQGVSIINMSFGGISFSKQEKAVMAEASDTLFVAAAGNDGADLGGGYHYYPASYALPNVLVVGALGASGEALAISNYGAPVKYWEQGEAISTLPNNYWGLKVGTSMAAAVKTGKLIKELYAKTTR